MELPLKIVRLHDLRAGMRLQLKAGEPESAEVERIDGNEVHFTDGSAATLEPRKDVAIFNPEYVPRPAPVNDIPMHRAPTQKEWRISDFWNF